MDEHYKLYDYQKDAVQKIISTPNTLLAFDVGAGKTYIMIAAAMKMRQEGISRKNMFVVPNNIVGQWEKIFTTLYPKAKLLIIEPKSFKPEIRKKILIQIKNGDYDGIIIAYSCFDMIPLSVEYLTEDMQAKIDEINETVSLIRHSTSYVWGEAPLELEKKAIIKKATELIDSARKKNYEITFDKLEINSIFLDEAHNYKNIPIRTKMKNLQGINATGSQKCLSMLQKYAVFSGITKGAVLSLQLELPSQIQ